MKNRTIWTMALALLLVMLSACAFAEAVPSITIEDVVVPEVPALKTEIANKTTVAPVTQAVITLKPTATAAPGAVEAPVEEQTVSLVVELKEPTVKAAKVLDEIAVHVETAPVTQYFAPEVVTEVKKIIPVAAKVEELKVHEFYEVNTANYAEAYGDVEATFEFATQYEDGKSFVAMIGIIGEDGEVTWMPMNAEVVDGKVKILFTQEVLLLLEQNEAVCALLGE